MRCVHRVRVVVVFSDNQLTSLPDWFGNLTQLTTLVLRYVSPSSWPSRRRVTRCVRCVCVVVMFSDNELTSLPDSIANLTQLTTLDLRCVSILLKLSVYSVICSLGV